MTADVLRVQGLVVHYHTPLGAVQAADNITVGLRVGERLGLVGESGSGKSTLALAILRMIKPPGRIEGGEIWLDDLNLMTLSEEEMRQVEAVRFKPYSTRMDSVALQDSQENKIGRILHQDEISGITKSFGDHVKHLLRAAGQQQAIGRVNRPVRTAVEHPDPLRRKPTQRRVSSGGAVLQSRPALGRRIQNFCQCLARFLERQRFLVSKSGRERDQFRPGEGGRHEPGNGRRGCAAAQRG